MDDHSGTGVYIGKELESREFTITPEFVARYMTGVGRPNPWYEQASPYGRPIAPAAILYFGPARLRGWTVPGARSVRNSEQEWSFSGPIYVGETLMLRGVVRDRYVYRGRDHVAHEMTAYNQDGKQVARGTQITSWIADENTTPPDVARRE